MIPPYLEEFLCAFNSFEASKEEGAKFPQTLRTAILDSRQPVPVFHLFPRELECLEYYTLSAPADFRSNWSALSGLKLKSLGLAPAGIFDVEDVKLLPSTLESLALDAIPGRSTTEWTIRILSAMPLGLKSLSGIWPEYITPELAQAIPRTLKWTCTSMIAGGAVSLLPPNTPKLDLSVGNSPEAIEAFPALLSELIISRLDSRIICLFPSTLKSVNVTENGFTLTKDLIEILPQSLERISVCSDSAKPIDSLESFKLFPRKLRSLILMTTVTARNYRNFETLPTPSESSMWLPPCLRVLQLGCIEMPCTQWLTNLPDTLERISLAINNVDFGPLNALANRRALTSMAVNLLGEIPKKGWIQCLENLPPNLLSLKYMTPGVSQETDLTNEALNLLPVSLTQLQLPTSPLINNPSLSRTPDLSDIYIQNHAPMWFKHRF
jgi:hypothetical protein